MAELFHVVYSKTVLAKFRRICALAKIRGEEQAVLTAGKQIDEALRSDPRGLWRSAESPCAIGIPSNGAGFGVVAR